jgi:hypothetical protein
VLRPVLDVLVHAPIVSLQLACRERVLGPMHVDVGTTLVKLSTVLRAVGRGPEALQAARRALAVLQPALGPGHKDTLACQGLVSQLEKVHP